MLANRSGIAAEHFGAEGVLPPVSEAERFAAAIDQMPLRVRAFFERDDPIPPWRWESAEDRAERLSRESFGGWCD